MNNRNQAIQRRFIIVLFILLMVALLGVIPCLNADGREYFMQLRSIILQGDPSYYDEFVYHYVGHQSEYFVLPLPSGFCVNHFSLGFAVLLTPFFLFGHGFALLLNGIGLAPPPNGYSFPEVLFTMMASAMLGSLGVLLSAKIAARINEVKWALWATLGLWLASPLPVYLYAQPNHGHALSVLTTAFVLLIWLQSKDNRIVRCGVALGIAIGCATLVRWQDGLYLLLPIWDIFRYWKHWKFRKSIIYLLTVGITAFVVLLPQLILWKIHFGTWITIPQGQGFMHWSNPQIWQVLFGARHGLFSWTPIIGISFIGMIWLAIRLPKIGIPLLAVLLIQIYVNATPWDWWAAWAFGARRFLDLIPFFILATAFLFKQLPRSIQKVIPFLVGGLIIWNLSLMYQFFVGHAYYGKGIAFSTVCQQNWNLLTQRPLFVIGGIVLIALILWCIQRLVRDREKSSLPSPLQWLPTASMMAIALVYFVLWSLNLTRSTIDIEKILALNPTQNYREWVTFAYKPPFQGCGWEDIATRNAPWQHLAPWSVEPGGRWKLVTACDGSLSPGDTAAFLKVESTDGSSWESPLLWERDTGSKTIPRISPIPKASPATIARLGVPVEIETIAYRTFKPLPLYFLRWVRFMRDYATGRIPLNASYEFSFVLPENSTPKNFQINLYEAQSCHIYGIGKVETP